MNTNNPNYGYFDISNTLNSERTMQRKIIGNEPKILKDSNSLFSDFNMSGKGLVYKKKNKISFDNCRDIFRQINILKNDIDRYRKIGVEVIIRDGSPDFEINWNKVANRVERELYELYELL